MTRYTVVWHEKAEAELARLWLESLDLKSITTAANSVDSILKSDPEFYGMPEDDKLRRLVVFPLSVLFHVRDDDRVVEITAVERVSDS